MMILRYPSKKVLKEQIGKPLKYQETCTTFGFPDEYCSNGTFTGCNRPHITGYKREFFAVVTMENDLIKKVK